MYRVSIVLGMIAAVVGCLVAEAPPVEAKTQQYGIASYYWQPQRTAMGGWFNPQAMTAAHKHLPFGTRVRVTHLGSGRSVVVRINDRGPYIRGRIIDLSLKAATRLGMRNQGVARVRVDVLGRGGYIASERRAKPKPILAANLPKRPGMAAQVTALARWQRKQTARNRIAALPRRPSVMLARRRQQPTTRVAALALPERKSMSDALTGDRRLASRLLPSRRTQPQNEAQPAIRVASLDDAAPAAQRDSTDADSLGQAGGAMPLPSALREHAGLQAERIELRQKRRAERRKASKQRKLKQARKRELREQRAEQRRLAQQRKRRALRKARRMQRIAARRAAQQAARQSVERWRKRVFRSRG